MSLKAIRIINKFRILAVLFTLLPTASWAEFKGPILPNQTLLIRSFDSKTIPQDILEKSLNFRQWNKKEPMHFESPRGACDRAMNYIQNIFDHVVMSSNLSEFVTYNSIGVIYYCDKAGLFANENIARSNSDGNIEIDAELFNLIDSEDSLAFTIGHELGHFLNFHFERQIHLLSEIGYKLEFFPNSGFINIDKPSPEIWREAERVSISSAQVGEDEADRIGALMTYNAGYNPVIAVQFLEKYKTRFKITTHGTVEKRLKRIDASIGEDKITTLKYGTPILSQEFLDAKNFAELTARSTK